MAELRHYDDIGMSSSNINVLKEMKVFESSL